MLSVAKKPNPFAKKGAAKGGKCPGCGKPMAQCSCDMPKGKGKKMAPPFQQGGSKKKPC